MSLLKMTLPLLTITSASHARVLMLDDEVLYKHARDKTIIS